MFLVVYTLLAVATVGLLALSLVKWFREMKAVEPEVRAVSGRPSRPAAVRGYVPGRVGHVPHRPPQHPPAGSRERCDRLIVGVVTDEALFAAKGKHPVVPFEERCEVVGEHGDRRRGRARLLQRQARGLGAGCGFDVLFKGDDWRGTPKGDKLERDMASVGVEVSYFPYTAHTSSTLLRRMLAER